MTQPKPIRVMLVDDHDMVRRGLALFLHAFDDLQLVGQAANGVEALHLCEELGPDVVLMDLRMPEMDGITAIQAIRQRHPHIQVVAMTNFRDSALMRAAQEAGAAACLLKNVSINLLAEAIRQAMPGSLNALQSYK